jgi:hypothetical protein
MKDVRFLTGLEPAEVLRRPGTQELTRIDESGVREELVHVPVELLIQAEGLSHSSPRCGRRDGGADACGDLARGWPGRLRAQVVGGDQVGAACGGGAQGHKCGAVREPVQM